LAHNPNLSAIVVSALEATDRHNVKTTQKMSPTSCGWNDKRRQENHLESSQQEFIEQGLKQHGTILLRNMVSFRPKPANPMNPNYQETAKEPAVRNRCQHRLRPCDKLACLCGRSNRFCVASFFFRSLCVKLLIDNELRISENEFRVSKKYFDFVLFSKIGILFEISDTNI
jgi:hypothetical protein